MTFLSSSFSRPQRSWAAFAIAEVLPGRRIGRLLRTRSMAHVELLSASQMTNSEAAAAQGNVSCSSTSRISDSILGSPLLARACSGTLSDAPGHPPSAAMLRSTLTAALEAAAAYAASHKQVDVSKMTKRLRSDLNFLERCIAAAEASHASTGPAALVTGPGSAVQPAANRLPISDVAAGSEEVHRTPSIDAVSTAQALANPSVTHIPAQSEQPSSAAGADAAVPLTTSQANGHHKQPGKTGATSSPVAPAARILTAERLQGIANNLRGFAGELQAALEEMRALREQQRQLKAAQQLKDKAQAAARKEPGQQQKQQQQRSSQQEQAGQEDRGRDGIHEQGGTGQQGSDGGSQSGKQQPPATQGNAGQMLPCASCEVDVVAAGGSWWIEVKNQEPFSTDSEHWRGSPGGAFKGLHRQALDMLEVAQASCNARRWQPPRVCMYFPSGADSGVISALESMGVYVAVGAGSLSSLPPPPPEPTTTNLDTTTMCALISAVTYQCYPADILKHVLTQGEQALNSINGSQPAQGATASQANEGTVVGQQGTDVELGRPRVQDSRVTAWAARVSHWRECCEEEAKAPLLPQLARYLGPGRKLVAADVAVDQLQLLADQFAGPEEHARWALLRSALQVYPVSHKYEDLVTPRVRNIGQLTQVGRQQAAVFGLGDTLHAVTLSANGAAVRSMERQGVAVEAVIHRAVWLTGL